MIKYSISNRTPQTYVAEVKKRFEQAGDPIRARGQEKYMRNQFTFYGLRNSEVRKLARGVFSALGVFEDSKLRDTVGLCFQCEHREMHSFGIYLYEWQLITENDSSLEFLEELVCTKSWWDTVDWLSKLVGLQLKRFPERIIAMNDRWIHSQNIWLQRLAIIFQLKYKDRTDVDLLFSNILTRANSDEFFVQKGAGWALREYSKTDPDRVVAFIQTHDLPALTIREGLKWLKNQGRLNKRK